MVFDPFGRMGRLLPEELLHRVIRAVMLAVIAGFLWHRFGQYRLYAVKALWWAETLLFLALTVAFLVRTTPKLRSRGAKEIILPLVGSLLPFLLLLSPPSRHILDAPRLFYATLWLMTGATMLTVAGIWALRRSFSITVEVRTLVTDGPYRVIRHPVYLGEMLAATGVAVIRLSPANVVILALFATIQLYRARCEEEKLASVFPEYREFARRSLWFW